MGDSKKTRPTPEMKTVLALVVVAAMAIATVHAATATCKTCSGTKLNATHMATYSCTSGTTTCTTGNTHSCLTEEHVDESKLVRKSGCDTGKMCTKYKIGDDKCKSVTKTESHTHDGKTTKEQITYKYFCDHSTPTGGIIKATESCPKYVGAAAAVKPTGIMLGLVALLAF